MISPDIRLGDRISRRMEGVENKQLYTGVVVYVHPLRRYFTLRFHFPHGSFCESYLA